MEKEIKKILERAKNIRLLATEKEEVRENLELFIKKHPVINNDNVRHIQQESKISAYPLGGLIGLIQLQTKKIKLMPIVLVIALLVTGSASFAAENDLPGDFLYPVKINVNEEVHSLLAVSNEAQARWDARRAERRLEEAEELAARGELTSDIRAKLEAKFESHAEAFEDRASRIETKQGTESAFELHSNFEASLRAHERILAQISTDKEGVRDEIKPLLIEVKARLDTAAQERSDAEIKISNDTSAEIKVAAEGKLKAAEAKIEEARNFVAKTETSVSAETHAKAEAQLNLAEEVIARGKVEIENEMYGKAFASFQEAIRIAQEAKLIVETEDRIDVEIDLPFINFEASHKSEVGEEINKEESTETESENNSQTSSGVESQTEVKIESDSSNIEGEGKVEVDIGL